MTRSKSIGHILLPIFFFVLIFSQGEVCLAQPEQTTVYDNEISNAVLLSEKALFEAKLEEAKQLVTSSRYNNDSRFTSKHRIQLVLQQMRVEGITNILYMQRSDVARNLNLLLELLPHAEKLESKSLQGNFYLTLSSAYRSNRNLEMSMAYEKKALDLFNSVNDFESVAKMRANLISRRHNSLFAEGHKDEILLLIPRYQEEIKYAESYSKYALAYNTRHLAQIHRRQTLNYSESLRLFNQSLRLRQEIAFKPFIPASYSSLADVYTAMGEYIKAIETYEKTLELALEIGFVRYEFYPLYQIGTIYLNNEDKVQALEFFQKALESASSNNYQGGIDQARRKIDEINN